MIKKGFFLLAIVLVISSFVNNTRLSETTNRNIVVILVDDFGWTDLGCYGSSFYDTPNIDKLALDGVRFTNAYAACPVCSPSRASIQTGKFPVKTGVTDWIPGRAAFQGATPYDRWIAADTKNDLELNETTIAEALKQKGYQTFFAGKWHLGETAPFWPEKQGYDINKGGWAAGSPKKNKEQGLNGYFPPYGNPRLPDGPSDEYLPDRLTQETIKFINANQKKPFFVFLSFYLVHNPLQSKDSLIEIYKQKRITKELNEQNEFKTNEPWMQYATGGPSHYKERIIQGNPVYASMVRSLDDNLGKVLQTIDALNLSDNTLIIFTSDNGGLSTAEGEATSNRPLRGGKGWLYEGGIRVPMIIRDPENPKSRLTNNMPASGIDIFPTVMDYAGIDLQPYTDIDGIDLLPMLNKKEWPKRPLFWYYPHYSNQGGNPGSIIRLGDYKLIEDFETGKLELYNLADDIGEDHDLSSEKPKIRDELWYLLKKWEHLNGITPLKPNPDWNGGDPVVE